MSNLVAYVKPRGQVVVYDKSRPGIHPGSPSESRYALVRCIEAGSWEKGADIAEKLTGRRPTRRGVVEPTLEDLRRAADEAPLHETVILAENIVRARDERVRRYVLKRANGCSEFSGEEFPWGLDTHHVVALADGGEDSRFNVIALTPNEHRRAGKDAEFNAQIAAKLAEIEPRS